MDAVKDYNNFNQRRHVKPVLFLLVVGLALAGLCTLAGAAIAQQPCPGVVRGAGNVNIRSTPNTAGNSPVSTLAAGTAMPANAVVNGWHLLCGGNFISGSVVTYSTNTPAPLVSLTPSPTRLVTNTALPPAVRTQVSLYLAREVCVEFDDRGVHEKFCTRFPYDAKVTSDLVWVQP